jgi:signal transduction histidine kinase
MNRFFHNRFFEQKAPLFLCSICPFIFLWFACNLHPSPESHPDYFKPIFRQFDSLSFKRATDLRTLDSAFNAFRHPGPVDQAEFYVRKSDYFLRFQKDYFKALDCADSAIGALKKNNIENAHAALYSKAFFYKGDIYLTLLNFDKAFQNFIKGKEILSGLHSNPCELYAFTERIAYLHLFQKQYAQAASYYVEVCDELRDCWQGNFDKFAEMQGNLDNAGFCFTKAKKYDSAERYFKNALDFLDKNGTEFPDQKSYIEQARAVVYSNYAEVFEAANDYTTAELLLLKSKKVITSKDDYFNMSTDTKLARVYTSAGKIKKADSLFSTLKPLADKYAGTQNTIIFYEALMNFYISTKKSDSAFAIQQKYFQIKDSVEKTNAKFDVLNIKNEFEVREQKSVNDLLQKDNELKTVYLLISILASITIVVILLLVLFNYRRSTRYVQKLELLNMEVEKRNSDLNKAYQSLEQSHQENSRILKIVAHDLKNPISAIKNLTYSLIRRNNNDPEQRVLEVIQDSCNNSLALINDLLYEKKEMRQAGKEIVNIKKMLEYCVDLLQAKANEKRQRLVLEAENINALLDNEKMWRVISNIVNNAIKFSPQDSEIDIKLTKDGSSALLSVIDNGIGIPADIGDKIFTISDEFKRPGTMGEASFGLGLSISKKIVEEHGGRIWFESADGAGTAFYIELPCLN